MRRDDLTCRRLAVQLACQLLEDKDDCLRILEHVRTLIEFTTGRRYVYYDVPPDVADSFRSAFSKGRYFNARIRDRYAFTEVASAST